MKAGVLCDNASPCGSTRYLSDRVDEGGRALWQCLPWWQCQVQVCAVLMSGKEEQTVQGTGPRVYRPSNALFLKDPFLHRMSKRKSRRIARSRSPTKEAESALQVSIDGTLRY